jgi:diguanylate cyclase
MPQTLSVTELAAEWSQICERYPLDVRQNVLETVREHREQLVRVFYERMLLDSASSFFLSDEIVRTRLHKAMEQWLLDVFELGVNSKFEEAVARQRTVGEAHARIGIPAHLVMRGLRCIDASIYELYAAQSSPITMRAVAYISQTTSMAIEIMCRTYAVSHDRNARAEESYRLFAMAQDIGAEKERQRAALYDWENQLMYEISMRFSKAADHVPPEVTDSAVVYVTPLPHIHKSEFGLWFVHKAAHIFEGSPDIASLSNVMDEIDQLLMSEPEIDQNANAHLAALMVEVRDKTQLLRFLLDQMFQQAGHIESGRDTLTNLLSRKYLQVIMTRQIDQARRNNAPLSVLTLDIDHFKQVNDNYGHDAGDLVLQQVARCLTGLLRGGDYIFRLGGEEFLVILVEANIDQAMAIAEDIRQQFAAERLQLPTGETVRATFSIGVACHDGHPDYQRLLKQSDLALYEAKRTGRNRVVTHQAAGFETALVVDRR